MTTVLIADDDVDIRELVAFKLAQKGYRVISTADGPAALAAVEAEPPELAVLDVTMPGMSGLDVCRALRANPATAGIAVILLTARAQEADVQAGFGSGADDYVLKPFSPRELLSRIEAVLGRIRR
jgi:DNA-binding response OmpR family regulator